MPANFDSYIANLKPVDKSYGKDWKTGNPIERTIDDDAVRRLALEVVKVNFPDIVQASTKRIKIVSGEPANYYAAGDYSPLSGEIRISGRETSRTLPQVAQTTDLKTGAKSSEVNITTEEVLRNVFTLLHESQHALGMAGFGVPQEANRSKKLKDLGITDDMLKIVNKIATDKVFNGALPSMNPGNSPDLEEFLANAIPLQEMEKRKMLPDSGRLRSMADTVKAVVEAVPQMQQFIESQKRPDLPTLKPSEPSALDIIKSALFGNTSSESK